LTPIGAKISGVSLRSGLARVLKQRPIERKRRTQRYGLLNQLFDEAAGVGEANDSGDRFGGKVRLDAEVCSSLRAPCLDIASLDRSSHEKVELGSATRILDLDLAYVCEPHQLSK
jgi:hypothetical protein